MKREEFSENFRKATLRSHEKALAFVENELNPPFTCLVELNSSFDGNLLAKGEVIIQNIRDKGCESIGPLSHNETIDLLWRDGLVPEWIDIMPWEAMADGLIFKLICCSRFAESEPLLYHGKEGYPPFHAPGVCIPPNWKSVEESGRFDVNWLVKRKRT